MSALQLGPLAFPLSGLLFLAGLLVVFVLVSHMERRLELRLEPDLWLVLLVGLLAARLGHILLHWSAYSADWLAALRIWQSGYSLVTGLVAAALTLGLASRRRRQALWLILPLLTGLLVWQGLTLAVDRLAEARQLPDIELADLNEQPVGLKDFQGRPLVVNLWASWCPPCRREMPALSRSQQQHPEIDFLFVNQREAAPIVENFLSRLEIVLDNVLLDTRGQITEQLGLRGLPTTLFFDPSGRLVDTHMGELSQARLEQYLREITR